MEALQKFLEKWLMPIASRIEKQRHLQSIKDGMIGVIPFVVVGSMCLLPTAFMNLIGSGPVYDALNTVNPFFSKIAGFTNDWVSIYAAYLIARSLAKRYDIDGPMLGISAIAVHLILVGYTVDAGDGVTAFGTSYVGATGLFVSIIGAIMTVEITHALIKHHVVITLPDSVPSMVADSFSALIPLFATAAAGSLIATLCSTFAGATFPQVIMNLLAPAISSMDSLPALLIVMFLTQLLWFFGLHGPSITQAVWAPFALTYTAENAAAFAAGEAATHVFTYGFYYNIMQVTGSGLTLFLVIFMMFSKSDTYKAIGRAAIVPSIFGINEPVIYGAPVMLNPFLFIPFVFGPCICTAIAYLSMTSGIVAMPVINPPGFLPPGVSAYLMTLDWKAVVLVFVLLILMGLFYYPFFKAMEKNQVAEEKGIEA